MPNPILPLWEYIPDGEPRVFGDRVYIYGSHDSAAGTSFCDSKLKVWSASVDNLNEWQCHGHSFHTRPDRDHPSDTAEWTENDLYAPDVVEKDGKYYLFAYIVGTKGCVGVSDKPEGPFKLLSRYTYDEKDAGDNGIYNDAGVLVDDDGRVYVYYGYTESYMNELEQDMHTVKPGSLKRPVMPDFDGTPEDRRFFEASSIRKINGKYYFVYSPIKGSRLAYAISDSPTGPFEYKGYIIDNGNDYPAGNDHGSLCCIKGQWYIFYHRMTNNTILSRRACVERVQILPDGTIPTVEMTSLGFDESLNPYQITPAEICCVLKGGAFVTEKDVFTRVVTDIKAGCIIGYKYFDFGEDNSSKTYKLALSVKGMGMDSKVHVLIDDYDNGEEIGVIDVGTADGTYTGIVKAVTGRHALYFKPELATTDWCTRYFTERTLFEFDKFVFLK
ncbi:MAG: family 43 glycosylhydrolase [Eubacterium sp.]|nr:family 43 glycosylhydrolase [Eubacterium sp.]